MHAPSYVPRRRGPTGQFRLGRRAGGRRWLARALPESGRPPLRGEADRAKPPRRRAARGGTPLISATCPTAHPAKQSCCVSSFEGASGTLPPLASSRTARNRPCSGSHRRHASRWEATSSATEASRTASSISALGKSASRDEPSPFPCCSFSMRTAASGAGT